MSFPRYPEYKDSGAAWLDEVPSNWSVQRLKYVSSVVPSNVDKKTYDDQAPVQLCNYTDVYYRDLINADIPFMPATATDDQIDKFSLKAGDVLITKDSETPDDIAVSAFVPADLPNVVCGYHLALIRPGGNCDGKFIKFLFDSSYVRSRFAVLANGLTRYGLSQYALDNIEIPIPTRDEQRLIAAFLDRETGKIDALIVEQEKLIALLKEKRQALISHAVTKGLDPSVPMKNSGIEWLGQVPAHWSVVPLMHLTEPSRPIMYGIVLPGPDVEEGVTIVKGGDVRLHKLNVNLLNRTTAEIEAPFARARLRPMDIVYSIRGSIGDAEVVPDELLNANITQDVARISPKFDIQTGWLLFVMKSKPVFVQLEQRSLGAAVRGINIFELKRARIPVPPSSERNAIADFLKSEIGRLDELHQSAKHGIALLKERRSAMISAAVTGKIDVRQAA